MNHVFVIGRLGRLSGRLVEQLHMLNLNDVVISEAPPDVTSGYIPSMDETVNQFKEVAEAISLAKPLQPQCFFVMPKHHRINEHPNDDWRGQGNRRKRIKRNDR